MRTTTGPRVFVSSTCHDLIDLRAEVREHMEELGAVPVLSDVPETFDVDTGRNSIQTCLANVRTADVFVCILSKRYGSRLGSSGFDDLSATHLEYREACAAKKPMLFYGRDRLVGEFDAWRAGRRPAGDSLWLTAKDADGLFALLKEHWDLSTARERSNWISIFRDSTDLRRQLSKHLEGTTTRHYLAALMAERRLPELHATWVSTGIWIKNAGVVPALDLEVRHGDTLLISNAIADAGSTAHHELKNAARGDRLRLRWRDQAGHLVEDTLTIGADGNSRLFYRRLLSRQSVILLGANDPDPLV